MAFGSKDARGIYKFGEDDEEVNHSTLLNKGMDSVSDATKYFSGTPAQRAALNPAPEGATWVDTDTARRHWIGLAGAWVKTARRLEGKLAFGSTAMVGYAAPLHWSNQITIPFPEELSDIPVVSLALVHNDLVIWPTAVTVAKDSIKFRVCATSNAVLPGFTAHWKAVEL